MSLKEYTEFRRNFKLNYHKTEKTEEGVFINGVCFEDSEGNKVWENEEYINIGYNAKNSFSKVLSNLFPYSFKFKGKKVSSIEGILQSLKYKDKKIQNEILKYSGIDAYHTRACNTQKFWGDEGFLFWQGKSMKRDSEEYQLFLDEIYYSCSKNLIFKNALLETSSKLLVHHIGNEDVFKTVLTRYELELRLTSLREYLKLKINN